MPEEKFCKFFESIRIVAGKWTVFLRIKANQAGNKPDSSFFEVGARVIRWPSAPSVYARFQLNLSNPGKSFF